MSANQLKTMLEYYTVLQHNRTFSRKNHGHCRTHPQLNSPWDHVDIFETVFQSHGGGECITHQASTKRGLILITFEVKSKIKVCSWYVVLRKEKLKLVLEIKARLLFENLQVNVYNITSKFVCGCRRDNVVCRARSKCLTGFVEFVLKPVSVSYFLKIEMLSLTLWHLSYSNPVLVFENYAKPGTYAKASPALMQVLRGCS